MDTLVDKFAGHTYKVLTPAEDYKQAVVEYSSPAIVKITVATLEEHEAKLLQAKKETEANIKVSEARVSNIEDNHSFVKELSEQDLYTAWMYYDEQKKKKELTGYLVEINASITEYADTKTDMINKIGPIDSPVWLSTK
jgi:hypothetical protein